jgi:hypothetical protein
VNGGRPRFRNASEPVIVTFPPTGRPVTTPPTSRRRHSQPQGNGLYPARASGGVVCRSCGTVAHESQRDQGAGLRGQSKCQPHASGTCMLRHRCCRPAERRSARQAAVRVPPPGGCSTMELQRVIVFALAAYQPRLELKPHEAGCVPGAAGWKALAPDSSHRPAPPAQLLKARAGTAHGHCSRPAAL